MTDRQIHVLTGYARPVTMSLQDVSNKVYPGWQPLIQEMLEGLFDAGWDGQLAQIKEKFGSLRVYLLNPNETLNAIVKIAEAKSTETCRVCGEPGELRHTGWIKVLCDKHFNEGTH